jgi:hypothetical protein
MVDSLAIADRGEDNQGAGIGRFCKLLFENEQGTRELE